MRQKQQSDHVRILLADDDADDREFFANALKDIPIATSLKTVRDGEQLMHYLSKNVDELPDVLFLDFNMPRKNGAECLKEIKHSEALKAVPVVFISTAVSCQVADVLYNMGAHFYLCKCNFPELTRCIHQVLTLLAKDLLQPLREKFVLNFQEA